MWSIKRWETIFVKFKTNCCYYPPFNWSFVYNINIYILHFFATYHATCIVPFFTLTCLTVSKSSILHHSSIVLASSNTTKQIVLQSQYLHTWCKIDFSFSVFICVQLIRVAYTLRGSVWLLKYFSFTKQFQFCLFDEYGGFCLSETDFQVIRNIEHVVLCIIRLFVYIY